LSEQPQLSLAPVAPGVAGEPAPASAFRVEKKLVLALVSVLAPACLLFNVWEHRHMRAVAETLGPEAKAFAREMLIANAVAMAALICGVTAIAVGIAHFLLLEPLRRLVAMARAVRDGDLRHRLRLSRDDDIGQLANEMDATCDKLEAAQRATEAHIAALEQLRHSDRISTLGRLAASVAHELGTPLNVIELRAQMIASGEAEGAADARHDATIIVQQAQRMTRIIDEVLSFARRRPPKLSRCDLVDVVRHAIALSAQTAKKRNVVVRLDAPSARMDIEGDADKLLQIVLNLVINGAQAMRGGALVIHVREVIRPAEGAAEGAAARYACIDVVDQGCGIEKESLPRIFEPFFSTKSADEGTGLGLSIAQGIAREHQGWISVVSEAGHGAAFSVYLPRDSETFNDQ
jgi:signal transduction histidine kinase